MPAVTRELSIIYGAGSTTGETVGGTTDYLIDGKIRINKNYQSGTVSASVVVTATDEAGFATACAALETAFRKPRQRVRVLLGSATLIDWNPALGTNTGFDAVPTIEKSGDVVDTARTRRYEISVGVVLPADLTGQNGLRDATISVAYSPSRRRTVTIAGEYTALTSNNAKAQYAASVGTYASAIMTALSIADNTWELADETFNFNDTDKTCSFQRVYEEIIYPQSGSATSAAPDDTDFVNVVLTIARQKIGPGDSQLKQGVTPQRLVTLVGSFDVAVDKTQSTDLKGKWTSKLRPWVISRLRLLGDIGAAAVTEEGPQFDTKENKITGTLTIMGVSRSRLLEAKLSIEVEETSGLIFVPVWDGNRFSYYRFSGPASKTRTTTVYTKRTQAQIADASSNSAANVGGQGPGGLPGGGQGVPAAGGDGGDDNAVSNPLATTENSGAPGGGMLAKLRENLKEGWQPVSSNRTVIPTTLGIPPDTFDLLEETTTYVEAYIEEPGTGDSTRANAGAR